MIAYFPRIYEDELLYSVFARFNIHSGYLFFENTKDALFVNKETTPIVEFINKLKPDIAEALTKDMTMEEVILKHTMFPYYARFFNEEKKKNALDSLINMESDFNKTIPKKYKQRYLRYCPLCAKEDRKNKAEAIWYRKHQIYGISVCPIHGCKLINSNIPISRDIRIAYTTAEQVIQENIKIEDGTQFEKEFAVYVSKLLNPIMYNNSNVSEFFKHKRDITKRSLYEKIKQFYSDYEYLADETTSNSLIKVLNGNNDNVLRIILVAFYLKLPVEELIGSYESICALERNKRVLPYKAKPQYYWTNKDEEYLLKMDDAIKHLNGNENTLPERICIGSMERYFGLSKGSMKSMKKCTEYMKSKTEDFPTFHAKRAIWAIERLKEEGKKITWAQINVKANIMYHYKDACLDKLAENADEELLHIINSIR